MNKKIDGKNLQIVKYFKLIVAFIVAVFSNWKEFLIINGNDLLNFLRNLTPIILVFSISILAFSNLDLSTFDLSNWIMTFLLFLHSLLLFLQCSQISFSFLKIPLDQ